MIPIPEGNTTLALAMQYRLQQTQAINAAAANQLREQSLQALLKHALSTVPYYRDHPVIKAMGNQINWNNFPILTRSALQANESQLRSTAPPKSHGKIIEFRSSGSTGRPVNTLSSEYAQVYWRAMTVRDHIWARRDFSKKIAIIKFLPTGQSLYPGVNSRTWGPSATSLGYQGPSVMLNSSESTATQYRWLTEQQPDYLLTYPSALLELAQIQLKEKKLNRLKSISTLGENLSDDTRKIVETAFGCRIHDMYSSQEVGYIALQCPKHDHYHIQQENCMVEILDENDQPCPAGKMGRVVVTSLQNYIMPLIRYEIGDYAVPGEGCDCGITLPVIKHIAGRTRNLLTYPDGRKTWPSYNPMALMEIFPLARFQLEQTAINDITFRVMTEAEISSDAEQQAIKIIQDAMRHPFNITVEKADDLPRSAGGKYEEFKSVL
jgi:phenylacetate-CoA ligase